MTTTLGDDIALVRRLEKMPTLAEDCEALGAWLSKRPEDPPWMTTNEALVLARVLQAARAMNRCPLCSGMKILPNFMDAPGGPRCACGRPSAHESGECSERHGAIACPRCGDMPCPSCLGRGEVEVWGTAPNGVRCFIDHMACDRCKGSGEESTHAAE